MPAKLAFLPLYLDFKSLNLIPPIPIPSFFFTLTLNVITNKLPFLFDIWPIIKIKDNGWKLHHRDGLNHTEGDVMKYYDEKDVAVTSEMILNITKYLTL